jgi:hypothetical protein
VSFWPKAIRLIKAIGKRITNFFIEIRIIFYYLLPFFFDCAKIFEKAANGKFLGYSASFCDERL